MTRQSFHTAVLMLALLATSALAADWPTWRGSARDDISLETGLLKQWPTGGPKRLWISDKAGIGYSGFAIADGKLFTLGARDGTTFVMAFDANNGQPWWQTQIGQILNNGWGDGPRSSPAYSDGMVYALGGRGDLLCVKADDGTVVWRRSMGGNFGGKTPGWGYSESPLVDGEKLLVTPGGNGGAVVALNKKTGETIWRSSDFNADVHYSSIIAVDHGGKRQYIQLTKSKFVGLDAETGDVLWTSDWPGRTAVIPTPIYSDGHVYITSGYGVGCKLVELTSTGPKEIYSNTTMVNHHGGVILHNGHIFGYSDRGGWTCQNLKTGEDVWQSKELGKGAISYADGHFYCLEESSGTVALIEASTEDWIEKGRFKLDPQSTQRSRKGRVWTHPVIANGKLYLRDQEYLYCFDVKAN